MPSDTLQPKNPEIIAGEKICEEMREIAKKLPTPSGTAREDKSGQFGNNFYLLFMSINDTRQDSAIVEVYLKRMEKLYAEQWKKFLEENTSLMTQIQYAMEQIMISNKLVVNFSNLLFKYKNEKLASEISEEINIKGLGNDAWNRLNPLLRRASDAMSKCGINPEQFYG